MVKCCSVLNCKSGKKNERKKNNDCNVRQTSLFKIPQDPDKLQKWSSGLCQNLIANKFVCELHFNDDDIIKKDTVSLSNNDNFISTRKKYTLKPNAIPTINKTKTSLECNLQPNTGDNILTLENINVRSEDETVTGTPGVVSGNVNHDETSPSPLHLNKELPFDSQNDDTLTKLTIDQLLEVLNTTMLPQKWSWAADLTNCQKIFLFYADPKSLSLRFHIKIDEKLNVSITNMKTNKSSEIRVDLLVDEDFWDLLNQMENSIFCDGSGFDCERCSPNCENILTNPMHRHYQGTIRCRSCRILRRQLQNRGSKCTKNLKLECNNLKRQLTLQRRKSTRLQRKNIELSQLIDEQKLKCAAIEAEVIEKAIADLPEIQQKAVRACFDSAKVKNSKQRRYDIEWVYECLLMRIKSAAAYDRLRERQILPLPCKDTLNSYIQKLDSAFGFPKAIFDTLSYKASRMEVYSKRGTLLIDEVALSQGVKLNSRTMKLDGFVDLGAFTPRHLMNTRADHALVFMFQPFQGDWVQVVGSFLSKNSVTSDILHKLIIECTLLLEKAGFNVDCVTTDAAQWNRGAWKLFGIEDKKFSCEHPYDSTRRLWFASDFCHLLKNLRNGIIKFPSFWTPDGIVKMLHWQVLLKLEAYGKMNLKIGFKLSPHHLKPEGFEKMNVLLATQLFARQLRVAMSLYKNDCYELHDCEPTIAFMEKVDNLIKAMSSRTSETALRRDANCPMRKAIIHFDKYLRDWEKKANEEKTKEKINKKKKSNEDDTFDEVEENFHFPVTTSTLTGFKVTLGTTLELSEFLYDKCNYNYLMTSRLNQDALEKFFGIMRSACGCNDHPDPILFGQVFRLLCSYSLATPPRGSNVTGGELLRSLMHTQESLAASNNDKKNWLGKIDSIVEKGIDNDDQNFCDKNLNDRHLPFEHWVDESSSESDASNEVSDICTDRINCSNVAENYENHNSADNIDNNNNDNNSHCNDYENFNERKDDHIILDHDYDITQTTDYVVSYIAGFMARKLNRFTKCSSCAKMLTSSNSTERDKLIEKMSDGNLIYPSEALFLLIRQLESQVLIVVGTKNFTSSTMFQILDKVSQIDNLSLLGCKEHRKQFTMKIINNFIVMRGHFLTDFFNRNVNNRQIMTKRMRKFAKK